MTFKSIVDSIFRIIAELLGLLRVSRQSKSEETKIKNQEIFIKREENQQEVSQKDKDEKLIADVVNATPETKEQRLEELRKVISK